MSRHERKKSERPEVIGAAIIVSLKGGEQVEADDPELLRMLKEAAQHERGKVRDDDPGNR